MVLGLIPEGLPNVDSCCGNACWDLESGENEEFENERSEAERREICFLRMIFPRDWIRLRDESFGAFCQDLEHPVKARRVVRSVREIFPPS